MFDSKVLDFLKQSCVGMTTVELRAKCEDENIKNWLSELKKLKDDGYVRIDERLPKPVLKATSKAWPGQSLVID